MTEEALGAAIELLVLAAVAGSAIWVYLDATKHKIGRIKGEKGFLNRDAWNWAMLVILFWIVFLPVYLMKRGNLIEKAKRNPVEVKNHALFLLAMVLGMAWLYLLTFGRS